MPSFWREIADVVTRHTPEIQRIKAQLEEMRYDMTSAQSDVDALNALYTELDTWSNDVASELESLRQHAETGNVSAADVAARLTPIVARLKAAGQDGSVTGSAGSDPTTTTDPTNSPVATDPSVNPADGAPTDVPTPDPVVNPVDVPADSQAGSSANDAEAQGTVGTPATDVQPSTDASAAPVDNSASAADPTVPPADSSPSSTDSATTSNSSANTNDYREEY